MVIKLISDQLLSILGGYIPKIQNKHFCVRLIANYTGTGIEKFSAEHSVTTNGYFNLFHGSLIP